MIKQYLIRKYKDGTMKKLWELLQGKKSYIIAVILAAYTVAKAFGLTLTPEQDEALRGLLYALFGMAMAAKVNRQYR